MPTTEDERAQRANGSPPEATDGSGSDGVGEALAGSPVRTGAALAAAGALVGAAIGAANAIRSRADQVSGERDAAEEPAAAEEEPDVEDREDGEEPEEPDSVEPSAEADAEAHQGEGDEDEEQEEAEPNPQLAAEAEQDDAEADEDEEDEPSPQLAAEPDEVRGDADEEEESPREFAEGTPGWVTRRARDQLGDVTQHDVEGVLALERTDGGWLTRVEVVELRRVPSTTDVIGVFDVELDERGEITNYQRTERYVRNQGAGGS